MQWLKRETIRDEVLSNGREAFRSHSTQRDLFLHLQSVRVIKPHPLHQCRAEHALSWNYDSMQLGGEPVPPGLQEFTKQQINHRKGSEGASRPVDLKPECATGSPGGLFTRIPGSDSQRFWFRGGAWPSKGRGKGRWRKTPPKQKRTPGPFLPISHGRAISPWAEVILARPCHEGE